MIGPIITPCIYTIGVTRSTFVGILSREIRRWEKSLGISCLVTGRGVCKLGSSDLHRCLLNYNEVIYINKIKRINYRAVA